MILADDESIFEQRVQQAVDISSLGEKSGPSYVAIVVSIVSLAYAARAFFSEKWRNFIESHAVDCFRPSRRLLRDVHAPGWPDNRFHVGNSRVFDRCARIWKTARMERRGADH
jgi:hypothetical protein